MVSGAIAIIFGALAWAFVEGFGAFYPAKATWMRMRSQNGRRAVRAMRRRFESAAERKTPRWLVYLLAALVVGWIASASLLDKRWWEVVLDVLPYVFVGIAFLRLPANMARVSLRMRDYERDAGEDPDKEYDDFDDQGGVAEIAL